MFQDTTGLCNQRRSLRLLNPWVEALIEQTIRAHYLSRQRPRIRALVGEIALIPDLRDGITSRAHFPYHQPPLRVF